MLPLLGACCWCLDMATHIILKIIPLLCAWCYVEVIRMMSLLSYYYFLGGGFHHFSKKVLSCDLSIFLILSLYDLVKFMCVFVVLQNLCIFRFRIPQAVGWYLKAAHIFKTDLGHFSIGHGRPWCSRPRVVRAFESHNAFWNSGHCIIDHWWAMSRFMYSRQYSGNQRKL